MSHSLLELPAFQQSALNAELTRLPLGFIDIGARGGQHAHVEPLAARTAILAFEPDPDECNRIRVQMSGDRTWARYDVEPAALADTAGEAILYLTRAPINSSLLRPREAFYRRFRAGGYEIAREVPVHTERLDDILFGRRATEPFWGEFLKIDTQGTELAILRGAERTLAERTVAVIIETEFCPLYEGQPLFAEVESFLRQRLSHFGFLSLEYRSLKALDKRHFRGRERLLAADAIFFKDPLADGPPPPASIDRPAQILFTCALLSGFYDYALELVRASSNPAEEKSRLHDVVEAAAARSVMDTASKVASLAQAVKDDPELANILVGRFVDGEQAGCDYRDVDPRTGNVSAR